MHYSKFSVVMALMAVASQGNKLAAETQVSQLNPTAVEVSFDDGRQLLVDFYGPNVFRLFQDPQGGIVRNPEAQPPAQILVDSPRANVGKVTVTHTSTGTSVATDRVRIDFAGNSSTFTVTDLQTGKTVIETLAATTFDGNSTTVTLKEQPEEYFYGGGVQNGRFSHKGHAIDIVNTNSWTDGGVASPAPFFWSTGGYGAMWHTFAPGKYDFGAENVGTVALTHETPYLDLFIMVDQTPVGLLNDFYQLTGNPVLLPKFGFYEGHLNAYNRDYWKEVTDGSGVLFEDGKYYRESQTDNGGIHESLNGELPGNYQFSARAVIDRYIAHDMPLGWILPNDGYGAGYGQTDSLEGNVNNLREFGEYARKHNVEIGLWTQSDLHPKDGIEPLLQRDIVREVRDAGVRVLKTDVAWVGAGYSFGLNGVADVGELMPYYGNNARPFIVTLDGWAGTQRYAGIWTGDQTGGEWEYIRFHVPTYIGSGLSGQPNIGSDMDGIFGGKNWLVNVRDFQWKTFTPLQLNMDGWGSNPKYPHALGEKVEPINRAYLKLKSELMPYTYTAAHEAVDGKPLIRAMFLDYPNDYTHGVATKYQFLYGPSMLVAPIYQETKVDEDGTDIRNNIYLPEGRWFDYFSGDAYAGGVVLNNFNSPAWKLPVFVKAGAIIPMVNPNNNPAEINTKQRIYEFWPEGASSYTEYDDDGTTEAYRQGEAVTTLISSNADAKGNLAISIDAAKGSFAGFDANKATELRINASAEPKSVTATIGGKKVQLTAAKSQQAYDAATNAYWFNEAPNRLKQFGVTDAADMRPQLWVKLAETDITANAVKVDVKGFELNPASAAMLSLYAPEAPVMATTADDLQPYAINLSWAPQGDAASIEVEHNGLLYTNLGSTEQNHSLLFEDLTPKTEYSFKVRAVNPAGASDWTEATFTTADNPLEFAIDGITAKSTAADQPGFGIWHLFDRAERGDIWHTDYKGGALPFDMTIDLGSFNTLDRMEYLPRLDAGNGTLLQGTVAVSENGIDWSDAQAFEWERNSDTKTVTFAGHPLVRYIRLHVDKAAGNFGSGREIYVYKVAGTPSFIPGDINKDGKIDGNDLTSYMNYTGLRKGDGDFDYVSMGDVNRNGLIDAYDISCVATKLRGGIEWADETPEISGDITITPDKRSYNVGDEVVLTVKGNKLTALNAMSFALTYNPSQYEYVGTEAADALKGMENMTYDRLHTNGVKALYPTFVNKGDRDTAEGDATLCTIKFRAKVRGAFTPKATDIILVDKALRVK